MHEAFCAQIPLLLEMMEEYERYQRSENQVSCCEESRLKNTRFEFVLFDNVFL